MPIRKPWHEFLPGGERHIPGALGVYEIGDAEGRVLHTGYAGGRERFGLRSAIAAHFAGDGPARRYRYEETSMYLTRWRELTWGRGVGGSV